MQILVISDSHGKIEPVRNLLERYSRNVEMVIHLGDNANDLLQFQSAYPTLNMVAVAGNCDSYTDAPRELILTLGVPHKRRVLLLHGHSKNVKTNLNRLMYYSQEKEVDVCLFGHTHAPVITSHGPFFVDLYSDNPRRQNCLIMNPGSVGEPRMMSNASYGLLSIDSKGSITGEVYNL